MSEFILDCKAVGGVVDFQYLKNIKACYVSLRDVPYFIFLFADGRIEVTKPLDLDKDCEPELVEEFLVKYSPSLHCLVLQGEYECWFEKYHDELGCVFWPKDAQALIQASNNRPYYKNALEQLFSTYISLKDYLLPELVMMALSLLLNRLLEPTDTDNRLCLKKYIIGHGEMYTEVSTY
jgi:hypothetical protein